MDRRMDRRDANGAFSRLAVDACFTGPYGHLTFHRHHYYWA